MSEQRCGTCRWWVETRPYELGAMWPYSLGDCRFPMPFFLPQSEIFSNEGEECKAWHAKCPRRRQASVSVDSVTRQYATLPSVWSV